MNPFELAWLVWVLIWMAISFWSKPARRHESMVSRLLHFVPLMLAMMLFSSRHDHGGALVGQIVPLQIWFYPLGFLLTCGGLAFAVWARLYLGSNWSASVQVKQDHELVRTGPYRFVRHPIYTGMLAGFLGCALALDEWRGVLAFAIVLAGFIYKLRLEERWMIETFGQAYADYQQHTRALIPLVF